MKDSQTCETLKFGADLAKDYHKYSENILSRTRQLVSFVKNCFLVFLFVIIHHMTYQKKVEV